MQEHVVDRPRHRGTKTAIIALLGMAAVLGAGAVGMMLHLQSRLDAGIERFPDPFAGLQVRPAGFTGEDHEGYPPVTFLVLGSDSRIRTADPAGWAEGGQLIETVMIAQLAADRHSAHVLPLPHRALAQPAADGAHTVGSAFAAGGPELAVATVEERTGIRIDHVVVADLEAFMAVTDHVGGVDLTLTEPLTTGDGELPPGEQRLDGAEALTYVREAAQTPEPWTHHQHWLRATVEAIHREGTLTDPLEVGELLEHVGRTVAVDDGLSLSEVRNLVFSARNVDATDIVFLTAPAPGDPVLDAHLAEVYEAFATGTVGEFLEQNPDAALALGASGT